MIYSNIILGVLEVPVGIIIIKNRGKIVRFLDEKLGNSYRRQVKQVANLYNAVGLPFFRIIPWFFGLLFVIGGLVTFISGFFLY